MIGFETREQFAAISHIGKHEFELPFANSYIENLVQHSPWVEKEVTKV